MLVKLNFMNINKRHSKLKVRCFEMPNAPYSSRYRQAKKQQLRRKAILFARLFAEKNLFAEKKYYICSKLCGE
jgi:hypothetical protein